MQQMQFCFLLIASSLLIAPTLALWIYLEPRFDEDFINRNWDMLDRFSEPNNVDYKTLVEPVEIKRNPAPDNLPGARGFSIRKRNHEILNSLIGLPAKLRQRG